MKHLTRSEAALTPKPESQTRDPADQGGLAIGFGTPTARRRPKGRARSNVALKFPEGEDHRRGWVIVREACRTGETQYVVSDPLDPDGPPFYVVPPEQWPEIKRRLKKEGISYQIEDGLTLTAYLQRHAGK